MTFRFVGAHSDNFRRGREKSIQVAVFHKTASDNHDGTILWFNKGVQDRTAERRKAQPNAPAVGPSSAHLSIGFQGEIVQHVAFSDTAFHCRGANAASIGIEVVGRPDTPVTEVQYKACAELLAWLHGNFGIPIQRSAVFGHREISGNTTQCPANLDIDRIVREAQPLSPCPPGE